MNTDEAMKKCSGNGAHLVNQQQEVYQHRIPGDGRENGQCVHVDDTIWWGTCSFERDVQQMGEEGMKRKEWLLLGCVVDSYGLSSWSTEVVLIVGLRGGKKNEDSPRIQK